MEGRGNILQRVGAAPKIPTAKEDSDSEEESELDRNESVKIMNMKQEGPFLVPQLWKDNLNLDNLTTDFLESNVTGEVMNLDDFLKELQVNELAQQTEELQRHVMSPNNPSHNLQSPLRMPPHMHQQQTQQQQELDNRFHNLIRPANIDSLKEPPCHPQNSAQSRPSVMHHVGKPPDLNIKYNTGQHGDSQGLNIPPVSLPYREAMSNNLLNSHKDVHGLGGEQHHQQQGLGGGPQGQGGGIPQASVRPLVRPVNPVIMNSEKQQHQDNEMNDIKPFVPKRKRKISVCSNMTEEDDEDDDGGIGSFTSTVCVNFSEDDLRLATIPGQDFDPATRRFSEEELKPQPIIRKRKKQFVPDELKNNKYWAKRYKNNEAAKRSREARRLKENQIAMRARFLEEENTALKGEVDLLKKENSDLKNMMMALEEKLNSMTNNR